jgi:hypothetical protein
MKTFLRSMAALLVVLALVGLLHGVNLLLNRGIPQAVQHKSAQHAPGTVLSLTRIPASGKEPEHLRLCYSIDSFAEVAAEDRNFYITREHTRLAAEGPRCAPLQIRPQTSSLKPGEPLEIWFLLENGGVIDIARIAAKGQEIYPAYR